MRDWHGLDTVIAAMAAAGDSVPMDLIVVGDGPARSDLERQAAALGLADRVRFTGLQAREQVPALVAGFDIALQPRVVEYASPLKIFEYMAAGRAIVAPDQENIREILRDGETALLFDPARPEAMWQAILRLAGDAPPCASDWDRRRARRSSAAITPGRATRGAWSAGRANRPAASPPHS